MTRVLATLLLLQPVFASAVPCQMSPGSQATFSDGVVSGMADAVTVSVDHSAHHGMAEGTSADTASGTCCDSGYCSQGGCLSISATVSSSTISHLPLYGPVFESVSSILPDWAPQSPYHPPAS
ncbi:MAG: hypothetical protein V2I38_01525 [Alcanivoracaceae bacterium]|nr:hypothetical protein [Alcanivoracaceae bacterium]